MNIKNNLKNSKTQFLKSSLQNCIKNKIGICLFIKALLNFCQPARSQIITDIYFRLFSNISQFNSKLIVTQ